MSLHIDISQSKINDNNLFKLKTSDVCYEKNDSIININSSGIDFLNKYAIIKLLTANKCFIYWIVSLQIDISQLNFNEDGEDGKFNI